MTREERELLFKDLCARLPYGVKAFHKEEIITVRAYIPDLIIDEVGISHAVEDCKPYLFPISSMTEEQKEEWRGIRWSKLPWEELDWLNKGQWDYRHLIEKGLAIDATELNIY